ncbi:PilZ domain-containing protein [Chondromyces crocatus]|uniref:PilZ domain-containing protein n=1 Tax=Chondromyces crocatus TaxID=52 RepID=A0A0K1EKG6_CHOCO|nr:PilZ domain-containing protein [Chondromyces crocatus]AKT41068.1 uncharacterized protein CMC5_052270 [Chondromyces crocatus]
MEPERRIAPRKPVRVLFNKYIDRYPHLGEILEISSSGMLTRTIHHPDAARACYAIELAPAEGEVPPVWLCARRVWTDGDLEALAFVAPSEADRERLEALFELPLMG